MANNYTGIYAKTLTIADFDTTKYDSLSIVAGVPVTLTYRVLPGQQIAFGNGSSSLNGVRTAKLFQLKPMDEQGTPVYIPCTYSLEYTDANQVRTTVLKQSLTDDVATAPTAYTSDVQAQNAYLPEVSGLQVGAYAYLRITLTPLASSAGHTFKAANSNVIIPITVYTLANASGQ